MRDLGCHQWVSHATGIEMVRRRQVQMTISLVALFGLLVPPPSSLSLRHPMDRNYEKYARNEGLHRSRPICPFLLISSINRLPCG